MRASAARGFVQHRVELAERARGGRRDADGADHADQIADRHDAVENAHARDPEHAGERDAAEDFQQRHAARAVVGELHRRACAALRTRRSARSRSRALRARRF